MSAKVITGYTGERHITPAMDAAVYKSIFGADSYILRESDDVAGSMPDINSFIVADGMISMQGRQIQIKQETLTVDTCASAKKRIDLVALRFTHDSASQVDAASLVVIKGTEVAASNDPVEPAHNTGNIDEGASTVDFVLYRINLNGSTVTFERVADQAGISVETTNMFEAFGWSTSWRPADEVAENSDES